MHSLQPIDAMHSKSQASVFCAQHLQTKLQKLQVLIEGGLLAAMGSNTRFTLRRLNTTTSSGTGARAAATYMAGFLSLTCIPKVRRRGSDEHGV